MRTTIDIDDELFATLKRIAAEEGSTLRSVVQNALRAELARRESLKPGTTHQRVKTFRGRGVQPGVNIDSSADLLELMEGRE